MIAPMRLVLLGHFPVDAPPQGGVQSVIANLRDVYAARPEIELHLVQHRRGVPVGTFMREGYTMHNLAASAGRGLPNMFQTRGLVASLLQDLAPDAVSSHQPVYALAAFDSGFPTVHTIHGFPANEFWTRRGFSVRAATLWEAWLEQQTLRRAQHIIAISNHVIEAYRHRTHAQFHRVDNPIAPLFFEPGPPPEPGRLLLVGNLTTRKGVEVAIAAVARLLPRFPALQLDIVGAPVDAAYTQRLQQQAQPLGQAVRFCGAATQAGVKQAIDRAQALALTSYEEHAPMIVAEAMAAGRAVVATQVGGLADMVEPGKTGYLARPGDVAAIADALARLLADPDHARALGETARTRARARFHPQAVAAGYLRALAAAMSARRR